MAAKFLLLTRQHGEEMYVRPEAIMSFGSGSGFPSASWVTLWGSDYQWHVRETTRELATLLTNGDPTHG
jgi:hypothetical protein